MEKVAKVQLVDAIFAEANIMLLIAAEEKVQQNAIPAEVTTTLLTALKEKAKANWDGSEENKKPTGGDQVAMEDLRMDPSSTSQA